MLNLYKNLCLLMLSGPLSLLFLSLLIERNSGAIQSDLVDFSLPYVILINFFCLMPLSILGGVAGVLASIKWGRSSFAYGLGMLLAGIASCFLLGRLGAMIT